MNKLFEEALPFVEAKSQASKEMSRVSKHVKDITHYDSEDITTYKDMIHYKSLGWTDTPITRPDPAVKFKDRVSPCFRRLTELVRIAKAFGDVDILKEYIDACKEVGVEIIIHDIPDNSGIYDETKDLMHQMDKLQGIVCQNANKLRDMGEQAEEETLCPKGKFKELAESYYKRKCEEKDVSDALHKTLTDNLLHNNGIKEVLEENTEE